MAPHSSTPAWKIPWMEEPGRLQSTGSLRVRHDWATSLSLFTFMCWRRKWHPTPVLLPGKSHGQRSLESCSPWDRWGSDTTERLHFHFSLSRFGEGNGNPLQCSCRETPGTGEPDGLPSIGSHRVGHDWSDLAAAESRKLCFCFYVFFSSSRMRTLPHPHLQPPQHPADGFEESCFVGKNKGIFLHTCRLRKWYQSERNEDCYPGLLSQSQWQKRQNKSPIFHPPPKLYQLLKLRLQII